MKKLYIVLVIAMLNSICFAQAQVPADINHAGQLTPFEKGTVFSHYGYYEYLPENFTPTEKYPLIIAMGGVGQGGNGTTELDNVLSVGPLRRVNLKLTNPTNSLGRHFPAIIISPQSGGGWIVPNTLKIIVDEILNLYPVDTTKIYMTGMSAGGKNTTEFLASFPDVLAAAVPVCGPSPNITNETKLKQTPLWFFHNKVDPTVSLPNSQRVVEDITGIDPFEGFDPTSITNDITLQYTGSTWEQENVVEAPTQKIAFTVYNNSSHNAWTATYNNDAMWSWMFAQERTPLTVDAGQEVVLNYPLTQSESIVASASTTSGSISSYQWTQVSGSPIVMSNTNQGAVSIDNFSYQGSVILRVTVTTSEGDSYFDEVKVSAYDGLPLPARQENAGLLTPISKGEVFSNNGYYEYLPEGYDSLQAYPLLIVLGGLDEVGNGSTDLSNMLSFGPLSRVHEKLYVDPNSATGRHFPGVIISPQSESGSINKSSINTIIEEIIQLYAIDESRIYLTGKSIGGTNTWDYLKAYPDRIAAAIPICGNGTSVAVPEDLLAIPIWTFHNRYDPTIPYTRTRDRLRNITGIKPDLAYPSSPGTTIYTSHYNSIDWTLEQGINVPQQQLAFTIYPDAVHDAWTPTYLNDQVWAWLFAQQQGGVIVHTPPVANAGSDQLLTLPVASTTIDGSASTDVDNDITDYEWSYVSGPAASANSADVLFNFSNGSVQAASPWNNNPSYNNINTAGSIISNLLDENGVTSTVSIEVVDAWNGAGTNGVQTGDNSGDMPDDVLDTYWWFSGSDIKQLKITGLSPLSSYDLTLVGSRIANVTNNKGAIYRVGTQEVTLNASANTSAVTLSLVTADQNGEVILEVQTDIGSSYAYINGIEIHPIAGAVEISTPTAVSTVVSGLQVPGDYVFELKVTDQLGLFHTDQVLVQVQANSNTAPIADAGVDQTLSSIDTEAFLSGSNSTDAENNIVSYQWDLISPSSSGESLYFNFGNSNASMASPWNNLTDFSTLNTAGAIITNLLDENGVVSTVSIEVVDAWNGAGSNGTVTGDDSGDMPDNVLDTYWWFSAGTIHQLKISGLVPNAMYDFSYVGSRSGSNSTRDVSITIDGQIAVQNVINNTSMDVFSAVTTDANGEVLIDIEAVNGASHAYINGLIITAQSTTVSLLTADQMDATLSGVTEAGIYELSLTVTDAEGLIDVDTIQVVKTANSSKKGVYAQTELYPNPLTGNALHIHQADEVSKIEIKDMQSSVVYESEVNAENATVILPEISTGTYIVILYREGQEPLIKKLIVVK